MDAVGRKKNSNNNDNIFHNNDNINDDDGRGTDPHHCDSVGDDGEDVVHQLEAKLSRDGARVDRRQLLQRQGQAVRLGFWPAPQRRTLPAPLRVRACVSGVGGGV